MHFVCTANTDVNMWMLQVKRAGVSVQHAFFNLKKEYLFSGITTGEELNDCPSNF